MAAVVVLRYKRMGEDNDRPSNGHRLFTGVCENLAENESTGCGKRKSESSGRLRGKPLPFADDGFDKIITVESFYFGRIHRKT